MRTFKSFLTESADAVFYHVTLTERISSIQKYGLVIGDKAKQLWDVSKPILYAFKSRNDAIIWVEHTKNLTGNKQKYSYNDFKLISFKTDPSDWRKDDKIKYLKTEVKSKVFIPAKNIVSVEPVTRKDVVAALIATNFAFPWLDPLGRFKRPPSEW